MTHVNALQISTWKTGFALAVAVFILYRILGYLFRRAPLHYLRGPPGAALIQGHIGMMYDMKTGVEFTDRVSEEYGATAKIKGPFGADQLLMSDPRGIEHILLGAVSNYEELSLLTLRARVCFGPGVLGSTGKRHNIHRRLLAPSFAPSHTSKFFPAFYEIGHQLKERLTQSIDSNNEVEFVHWMITVTMECIGHGGFGYRFGMLEGSGQEYHEASRLLLPNLGRLGILEPLGEPLCDIGPPWLRRLAVDLCPLPVIQDLKKNVDVIWNTAVHVFEDRRRFLEQEDAAPHDPSTEFQDTLTMLMRSNSKLAESERLTEEELTAELSTLMFAGTETLAEVIARLFYLLACHQDVQDRIRKEVTNAQADDNLNYDTLMSLPFLDAVCKETLRVYPPVPRLARTAQGDDTIPLLYPVKSRTNQVMSELPIPKGTTVWVDILGANRNPDIWGADAREWKPERWFSLDLTKKQRLPGVYSNMMTFFGGDRGCPGFRMALLEIKVIAAVLLPTLRFELSAKPIVWRLSTTLAPFVSGEEEGVPDSGPELPMRVSFVAGP